MAWRELGKLFTLKNWKAIGTLVEKLMVEWEWEWEWEWKRIRGGERHIQLEHRAKCGNLTTGSKKQFITHKFIIYSDVILSWALTYSTLLPNTLYVYCHRCYCCSCYTFFYHHSFYVHFYLSFWLAVFSFFVSRLEILMPCVEFWTQQSKLNGRLYTMHCTYTQWRA